MNKICSFFIIIIIIYLSYDYCSRSLIEGQGNSNPDYSKFDEEKQDAAVGEVKCKSPPLTTIEETTTTTDPCSYEKTSCIGAMDNVTTDTWGTNWNISGNKLKQQCSSCVQGSQVDGSTRHVLANVGKKPGSLPLPTVPVSKFAEDMCDAMVAGCDKSIFYANNRQDGWTTDCAGVDDSSWAINKLNKGVCTLLQNSIIQFFLGFMGGIECTLKIKAHKLLSGLESNVDCDMCCAATWRPTDSAENDAKAACAAEHPGPPKCKCS